MALAARRAAGKMYRSALSRTLNGCVAGPSRLPRVAPLQQMLSISHREPLVPARARSSIRNFSASSRRREQQQQQDGNAQKLGEIEPKLALTFTCTVEGCGERSSHQFTKRSYERGIVLVQCPGCKNRHLIADHLGWFAQEASEPKTIEEMVAQKGGRVQRGINWVDDKGYDTVEIFDESTSSNEDKK